MNIEKNEINATTSKTTRTTVRTTIVALTVALIVMMVGSTAVTTAATPPPYYPMTLQADGGTFVNPVMQVWATAFQQYTSSAVKINYQAVGTGAGQTDILSCTSMACIAMFAGGDAPISASQLASYASQDVGLGTLLQFPEALGGVAIFYNVPGVTVSLNFTGSVIADIYTGLITTWNDPAIQALNPGCYAGSKTCVLPADTITPVHRSDGSGTTYAFTNYLSKVSSDWNASWTDGVISTAGCPCFGTSISWPSFEIGAKGSSGVAAYVNLNPYSIGYADSYYAFSNGLKAAAVQNQAGVFLVPSLTDIAAAANAFSAQVLANPIFTITNAPGAGSYPISTYTYMYVWENQANYQQGYDIAQFFEWIVSQGQAFGPSLYYPALPASIVTIDQGIIQQMKYNGVPYLTTTTTTILCNSGSVTVGSPVTCLATVRGSGSAPLGHVIWSSSSSGKFSSFLSTCKVAKHKTYSTCTETFKPTAVGTGSVTLTANYGGDLKNSGSGGTTSLNVAQKATKTLVSCHPTSAVISSSTIITCTAKVLGYTPTGTVNWTQSSTSGATVSFTSTSCTLSGTSTYIRKCSVTMTPGGNPGKVIVQASYVGDSNNVASLKTTTLTIKT